MVKFFSTTNVYISVLMGELVDDLPPCEKVPGKITEDFKEHLDALKQ